MREKRRRYLQIRMAELISFSAAAEERERGEWLPLPVAVSKFAFHSILPDHFHG